MMSNLPRYDQKARMLQDNQKLSDVVKLSAHVTRILGQNPGQMTLQGTNSYLLQPPSSPNAPMILIDTSSPHTATQYVDLLITHLHHLGLESGIREAHFESGYAAESLGYIPSSTPIEEVKAGVLAKRADDPHTDVSALSEYGPGSGWVTHSRERGFPVIEHIILTHRHLDHVGALPTLLTELAKLKLPPPRIWKMASPDELELTVSDRDRPTTDAALVNTLPHGLYTPFSPFQPLHPIMPGLMISIIDPKYRHLLKHDKEGKPKWGEVPEVARVSVRCLKTPGHTADSISLVLSEGEKGVFTGDTVLGEGTTIFTDLSAYMLSLKTLLAIKPQTLYPGHGPHLPTPTASVAHIEAYIAHRQLREEQIIDLLTAISTDQAGPGGLRSRVQGFLARKAEAEKKEIKEKKEFFSGKPYIADAKKEDEQAKVEGHYGNGGVIRKIIEGGKAVLGGQGSQKAEDKEEVTEEVKVDESKAEVEEEEVKIDTRHKAFDSSAISLSLLTRLMYDTTSEKLIYVAQRPVLAHLEKLEKDGKVRKVTVMLPKIEEMIVGDEKEAVEGWKIVGLEMKKE